MRLSNDSKRIGLNVLISLVSALLVIGVYALFIDEDDSGKYQVQPQQTSMKNGAIYQRVHFATESDSGAEQNSFVSAADKTIDAIVHIRTTQEVEAPSNPLYYFFYGQADPPKRILRGIGSGVIISKDGYVVTNNHVIENTDQIEVTLNNNQKYDAALIGTDKSTDLAVLKIKGDNNFPMIEYGNSDKTKIGEWVLAIGNPFNLTSTVTAGIISAKSRNLGISDERYSIESFIQTDAALNKGSSGGALIDLNAKLIGINTAILSPTGAYAGESFAIPVNIVKKVVDDLIEYGQVQRAMLGIQIATVNADLAEEKDIDQIKGVYVADVTENGAAQEAGIEVGDVILKVKGEEVNTASHIQEIIFRHDPGDKIDVVVARNGKKKKIVVELKNIYGDTGIVESREDIKLLGAEFKNAERSTLDKLNLEGGVQVDEINSGKIKQAGIKEGFIVTKINGALVTDVKDLQRIINQIKGGVYVEGVYPNGVVAYYAFGI